MSTEEIQVDICYALPEVQCYQTCTIAVGTSAQGLFDKILPELCQQFPALTHDTLSLGIFSRLLDDPNAYILQDGDRLEIYRPLIIDPKEARRQRADKAKKAARIKNP